MAAPRVAPAETTEGQPPSAKCAVRGEGLAGIRRARGIETTGRRPARRQILVPAHQPVEAPGRSAHLRFMGGIDRAERLHDPGPWSLFSSSSIRLLSSAEESDSAPGCTPMRYAPGGIRSGRRSRSAMIARRRRRSRLRTTAPPMRRPMANATRTGWSDPSATWLTQIGPLRTRRPRRRSSSKVDRSRIDQIRPTAGPDPCGDGP